MATKTTAQHVAAQAMERITREWGSAFALVGPRMQRAIMAEAVVIIAATQHEGMVTDAMVRRIVKDGWTWAVEESGYVE